MADSVRVWLVERDYDSKGLVRLTYATPDGDRAVTKERSAQLLRDSTVTAATTVAPDALEPVEDDSTRERYRAETTRMADRHDPGDEV